MKCKRGHDHLTAESAKLCDEGRVGWWGCSLATDKRRWDGHFMHVSLAEAEKCDLNRGIYRTVVET